MDTDGVVMLAVGLVDHYHVFFRVEKDLYLCSLCKGNLVERMNGDIADACNSRENEGKV